MSSEQAEQEDEATDKIAQPPPLEVVFINVLNNFGVPCALVGDLALRVYGMSVAVRSIDLVLDDNIIPQAVYALHQRGFQPCRDPYCEASDIKDKYFLSSQHYHIPPSGPWKRGLFNPWRKSHLLEQVPGRIPLPDDLANVNNEAWMLTNSPLLPSPQADQLGGSPERWVGRWQIGVVIATPKAFIEQMFWHMLRDLRPNDAMYRSPWEQQLCKFAVWLKCQPTGFYPLCSDFRTLGGTILPTFLNMLLSPYEGHREAYDYFYSAQSDEFKRGHLSMSPRRGRKICQPVENYALAGEWYY
ncbi:uncharacterized protein BO97DRAFT_475725 [Aspergillus homomorphus CBS 101889]|uniref:Uncharacterized protein n=1 Tax=Aspergillus homomorphus (strain CBS 101889) TaxID=1450537 RepID=A0A395I5H1_ASPHC|nr:hypothetical protein BO97DRAFT_475725 [Aspergillus homomorphus CBS 101889]RAL15330.1 hypothetical protein BO97DRAFT_475725 [Aspergillus homomorphus CBS 101889]